MTDKNDGDVFKFADLVDAAEKAAGDLQPWPNYYKLRAKEMEALFSLYGPASRGRALDIGAGMAFNALMLDRLYDSTVASDLDAPDAHTHSLGMTAARSFLDKMPHKNIELVSARCEGLPFEDGCFDTIYMIYTLEHIKDKEKALREALRVAKPGGEIIVIVPNFMERLLSPFSFYTGLFKKVFMAAFKRKGLQDDLPSPIDRRKESFSGRLANAYPHFPFPDPHGEYPDYFCELALTNSAYWRGLANSSGLKTKDVFTTMVFPKDFLSVFSGEKALEYYIRTLWLNKKFGKNRIIRHLGQNLCLILKKDA